MDITKYGRGDSVQLSKRGVQIWYTPLHTDSVTLKRYSHMLSDREEERVVLLHSREKKAEYIIVHGALRILLGMYLGKRPADVCIETGDMGKPVLPESDQLHFSIATSGEFGVFAFSLKREVGVDIEKINRYKDLSRLINHSLSAEEKAYLFSFPKKLQNPLFYAFWTRKEALLKAMGTGIDRPLNLVTIPLTFNRRRGSGYNGEYLYREFELGSDHICTVAVNSLENENVIVGSPAFFA